MLPSFLPLYKRMNGLFTWQGKHLFERNCMKYKCYFTAWFGTDLLIFVERSKVITHVKLLSLMAKICECKVNVNCMLHHSAYVLSKLILRLSEEFEIMISTKTVYSLQNFCGLKWRIWAIWWVLRWLFTTQEARVEMSFSIAKQIFTQKFESPGFQIEHQINWKADAFSHAIQ